MGAVNIGGAISAEPVTATALAVAFTVGAGIDQGAAITLAVPVGVVTAFLGAQKFCTKGHARYLEVFHGSKIRQGENTEGVPARPQGDYAG